MARERQYIGGVGGQGQGQRMSGGSGDRVVSNHSRNPEPASVSVEGGREGEREGEGESVAAVDDLKQETEGHNVSEKDIETPLTQDVSMSRVNEASGENVIGERHGSPRRQSQTRFRSGSMRVSPTKEKEVSTSQRAGTTMGKEDGAVRSQEEDVGLFYWLMSA